MKKKLLSALLAMVMVLTLLPLSAFAAAATPAPPKVTYYSTKLDPSTTTNGHGVGWYSSTTGQNGDVKNYTTYDEVTTGVVASNGTSNVNWFESVDAAYDYATSVTYIKFIGSASCGLTNITRNLTIDLNGVSGVSIGALAVPAKVTVNGKEQNNGASTLTITDTSKDAVKTPTEFTLTSITAGDAAGGKTFGVTLRNVKCSGAITIYSPSGSTVTLDNAEAGAIAITGTKAPGAAATATTSGGTITINNKSKAVSATITHANGTGGTITLGSDTASGTAVVDTVEVSSLSGGAINATNATIDHTTLKGSGTNLRANNSKVGVVELLGREAAGLTDAQKNSLVPPIVTISGGGAKDIKQATGATEALTKAYSVTLNGNARINNAVTLPNATINVTGAHIDGDTTLGAGTLTVTGSATAPASIGDLTLSSAGKTGNLVVAGTNVTVGDVSNGGGTMNITTPSEDSNRVGGITGDIANRGISGGTFASNIDGKNLNTNLRYLASANGLVTYYREDQFQKLIDFYQNAPNGAGGGKDCWISIVGQTGAAASGTITFMMDQDILTVLTYYQTPTNISLPTTVNGGAVTKWTETVNGNIRNEINPNDPKANIYSTPVNADGTLSNVILNTQVTDDLITKLTNVTTNVSGLTARLNGNVITLSGAVTLIGGTANIQLLVSTDGKPGLTDVPIFVVYDGTNKTTMFANQTPGGGMTVSSDRNTLRMPNDATVYTVNGSGLRVQADKLPMDQIHGYSGDCPVVTTVNVTGTGWTNVRRTQLGELMSSDNGVSFENSPAVKEALNAVVAGITDTQIDNWIRTARTAAWRAKNPTGTPTADQLQSTGYDQVHVVAYLAVTVSNYNTANTPGTLTATLVPSYRIEVRQSTRVADFELDPVNYVAQAGRTLGNLTGEAGTIAVTLPRESTFDLTSAYAHQGATYAYAVAAGSTLADSRATMTFNITHTISNGLGTIIINGNAPLVTLSDKDNNVKGTYDVLQAAVDDSKDGDKINVDARYTGATNVNVSGTARTITVNTNGANRVTSNASGVVVTERVAGTEYQIQLTRDTANQGNENTTAEITLGNYSNGTATLSARTARSGDTVTLTATPANGYRNGTPTVRTNTGASVSVKDEGNNRFSFVVPAGATSITVTPNFYENTGLPFTDVARTDSYFDAVKYVYENGLMDGTSTTTFNPRGYANRAQIVTVLWRQAGSPIETPTVTYSDVKSGDWYYNAVVWATNHGIAEGYGNGTFMPTRNINRQELAVFLHRYVNKTSAGSAANLYAYTDNGQVANWATDAMRWAVGNGIINGTSTTTLSPRTNAQRYQIAVTLQRYGQNYLGIR